MLIAKQHTENYVRLQHFHLSFFKRDLKTSSSLRAMPKEIKAKKAGDNKVSLISAREFVLQIQMPPKNRIQR